MIPASPLLVQTVRHAVGITTQLLGLAALAALFAVGAAVAARQYTDQRVPRWLAALVGLAPVILYLGTTPALESVLREGLDPTEMEVGLFNLGGVAAGVGGALAGRRIGDQFCREVLFWTPTQQVDDVSQLAQTVGQVTTVRLPAEIDDAIGYDPVPQRTKEALAGTTFVFPRTLTTDELEDRLAARLKTDYGVETVDAELDGDAVTYLAVGQRAAGVGSTLPAATNAVAVRADPAFSASTGDIVQVWEPESMRRVLTGELRGVADDVVTIAIDATDTPKVDPRKRYRLVTLPVEDRPDREFASLLRAAADTFSSAAVEAGSPLHGMPVAALDLTVVAVRHEETEPVVFPEGSYRLQPGDRLFVIGTAPELRRLETAAEALDPSMVGPPPSVPADRGPAESIETEAVTPADPDDQPGEATIDEGGIEAEDAASDDQLSGTADETTFEEIEADFDEADAGDSAPAEESPEPVEAAAAESEEADFDPEPASFDELRDELESEELDEGEEDDPFDDVEIAFEDDADESADGSADEGADDESSDDDELVSLDEADISFEDDADEESGDETPFEADAETGESALGDPEIDEDLQGESEESLGGDLMDLDVEEDTGGTDDLDDLEFEADDDESVFGEESLEDDEVFGDDDLGEVDDADEDDEDDDSEDEADDDDDDDSGGGGGKSFAELKDEFESGDADWEEDVSDSPGGDMRLDE